MALRIVLPSIVSVPINTAAPAIPGTPQVGNAITATNGTWDNAATLTIQWLRCAPGCAAIPGATSATYTPTLADEGKSLRADVTATATGGEVDVASSGLTAAVQPGVPFSTTNAESPFCFFSGEVEASTT